jgi:peptidoglycan/xylan/chitin deacetylase (PgdA/CDA1 family)
MGESARFIISLDCEGKWGMADHLQPYHHEHLTDAALTRAYERLIDLFGRYEVPATFAFVMAFVLKREEREHFAGELLGDEPDPWLRPYREEVAGGKAQGWHVPAALDLVRAAATHEVACHSFCHRPLGDRSISAAGASAELDAAAAAARLKGLSLKTFVFPRNEVGHLPELREHGFIGYRERLRRPTGKLGRALSLAEEMNVWAPAQQQSPVADGIVPIPSGRFLNWRFGARSWVPPEVTAARWRHQLRDAVADGGVVHLWLHPHNLLTAPDTEALLETVLRDVAVMRDAGRITTVTQRDYCREVMRAAEQGRH